MSGVQSNDKRRQDARACAIHKQNSRCAQSPGYVQDLCSCCAVGWQSSAACCENLQRHDKTFPLLQHFTMLVAVSSPCWGPDHMQAAAKLCDREHADEAGDRAGSCTGCCRGCARSPRRLHQPHRMWGQLPRLQSIAHSSRLAGLTTAQPSWRRGSICTAAKLCVLGCRRMMIAMVGCPRRAFLRTTTFTT